MVSLDCVTTTTGDVTMVTLALSSADPTHVRVANCLDGPVWPPREQGVPAAGWDEEGFSGVVDGRLALGYACPDDAGGTADPPARIVEERPPADEDEPTTRSLVRELGDASPPRDVVAPTDEHTAETFAADERSDTSPPPAVTSWLDEVARRLAIADRLAAATSVSEAADAVDAVGGPDEIHALRDQIATDRAALSEVADRCETLTDTAATVEIPVETLARLA